MPEINHTKILISPLNWGLGHATRCIPIIDQLINLGFEPVLAGDGNSLKLLKKEYPGLKHYQLPSYQISFPSNSRFVRLYFLLKIPVVLRAMNKERKLIDKIVQKEGVQAIISDERWGVRSFRVPSVIISHQLNVLSGFTTKWTGYIHRLLINKFDECWVPDLPGPDNLTGKLTAFAQLKIPLKFIGVLSRMKKKKVIKDIDWLAVISGPEPQRKVFEKKVFHFISRLKGNRMIIQGKVGDLQVRSQRGEVERVNFMLKEELEHTMNRAKIIICRSGYSTLMDLSMIQPKVVFVPTPRQFEQEYLAQRMKELNLATYTTQEEIENIKSLLAIESHSNFAYKHCHKEGQEPLLRTLNAFLNPIK